MSAYTHPSGSDSATKWVNMFKTPWNLGDASMAGGWEIRDERF
jgi:hypothetical protein